MYFGARFCVSRPLKPVIKASRRPEEVRYPEENIGILPAHLNPIFFAGTNKLPPMGAAQLFLHLKFFAEAPGLYPNDDFNRLAQAAAIKRIVIQYSFLPIL